MDAKKTVPLVGEDANVVRNLIAKRPPADAEPAHEASGAGRERRIAGQVIHTASRVWSPRACCSHPAHESTASARANTEELRPKQGIRGMGREGIEPSTLD
jgi:hypothetical protein